MHRRAFVFTVNKVVKEGIDREELLKRAQFHDVDKMLLYTLVPKEDASIYHRNHATHHLESGILKNEIDYMEMVIDFECAGYTKPDKPLNAYDMVQQIAPADRDKLMPIIQNWDIASSYQNTPDDAEWMEYIKHLGQPTDKHYLSEIYQWIMKNPYEAINALQYAQMVQFHQDRRSIHSGYFNGYNY